MANPALVAAVGIVATVATFLVVRWDARRQEVPRPHLWAAIAAAPVAVGCYLYGFVPPAPATGTIMTANTGIVLYGFEREIANEGDEPADPGWLPGEPVGGHGDGDEAGGSNEGTSERTD